MLNSLQCSMVWLYQSYSSSLHPVLGTLGSSPIFVCLTAVLKTMLWWAPRAHMWHLSGGMLLGMDLAGVGVCISSVLPDIARIVLKWLFIDFIPFTFPASLFLFFFFWMGTSLLHPGCHLHTALPWRTTCLSCTDAWILTTAPPWFPEWTPVFPKHQQSFLLVIWNTAPIACVWAQMAPCSCWEVTPNAIPSSEKWDAHHTHNRIGPGNTVTFPGLRFAKHEQWSLSCLRERASRGRGDQP